jgi:hypothetical protein
MGLYLERLVHYQSLLQEATQMKKPKPRSLAETARNAAQIVTLLTLSNLWQGQCGLLAAYRVDVRP